MAVKLATNESSWQHTQFKPRSIAVLENMNAATRQAVFFILLFLFPFVQKTLESEHASH